MTQGGLTGIWLGGLRTGVGSIAREPLLGLKRLVLPASYWRSAEFAYVHRRLVGQGFSRLLDLGSPKDLAILLARDAGFEVVATDILDSAVDLCERYAAAQGITGQGPGLVFSETQDGRSLTYADGSFDAAFSVSVIEHIPDDGDSSAMAELVRVVRPGGLIVVTTPFDTAYRETFVEGDVYERKASGGEPVFFERHYDPASLTARLLSVPGTRVVDRQLWGERFVPMEGLLGGLGPLRVALSPFESLLAAACLVEVPENHPEPKAVFFTLEKVG